MAVRVSLLVSTDPNRTGYPGDPIRDANCIKQGMVLAAVETSRVNPCAAGMGWIHVDDNLPGNIASLRKRFEDQVLAPQYMESQYKGGKADGDLKADGGDQEFQIQKRRGWFDLSQITSQQHDDLFGANREVTMTFADAFAIWVWAPLTVTLNGEGRKVAR